MIKKLWNILVLDKRVDYHKLKGKPEGILAYLAPISQNGVY